MDTHDNLNIVLIGMPGAGKSYIGSKLTKLLVHFCYVDIDEEIEKIAGLKICDIFELHGEKYFRQLETKIIKEFSREKNRIISVGGGAFENPENIAALKKNGIVFYLKASVEELFKRVMNETHRPLLNKDNPQKVLKNLLKKREKNLLKADFVIDTERKPAYTILDDILREYENYVRKLHHC